MFLLIHPVYMVTYSVHLLIAICSKILRMILEDLIFTFPQDLQGSDWILQIQFTC